MNASNLPPGVSVNDIPGNRPEDVEDDKFWDEVEAKFKEAMPNYAEVVEVMYTTTGLGLVGHALDQKNLLLEEVIHGYATVARDLAYARGLADAKQDAVLDEAEAGLRISGHELVLLERFHAAGWQIADDGDPYKPE